MRPHAQQNYLSANYTHVIRDVMARGVNVIAHLVAKRVIEGRTELSFGSNADVTADLLPLVEEARRAGRDCVLIGEVHAQMPFMTGHATIDPERFDWLVDDERYDYDLYCPPNLPIGTVDHAIGMHVSALVRDGGTLQVGIGELGRRARLRAAAAASAERGLPGSAGRGIGTAAHGAR